MKSDTRISFRWSRYYGTRRGGILTQLTSYELRIVTLCDHMNYMEEDDLSSFLTATWICAGLF